MSRQICHFVSCVSEDRRLKESRICSVFSSPTHPFFLKILSETSGLGLATLQDKLAALCTVSVLPGGVCEDTITNEATDGSYLAFPVWAHLCPGLGHSSGHWVLWVLSGTLACGLGKLLQTLVSLSKICSETLAKE